MRSTLSRQLKCQQLLGDGALLPPLQRVHQDTHMLAQRSELPIILKTEVQGYNRGLTSWRYPNRLLQVKKIMQMVCIVQPFKNTIKVSK